MPINPNKLNIISAYAAQQLRKQVLQPEPAETELTSTQSTEEKDAETPAAKPAPPARSTALTQAEIYSNAIIKTVGAARNVAGDTANLLFREGAEAARNAQVNLSPGQKQVYAHASTSSTRAIREGSAAGAAAQIATTIKNKYTGNPNFDQDTVDIAAEIIETFLEGGV